jgi:shikimate dehydrogenase
VNINNDLDSIKKDIYTMSLVNADVYKIITNISDANIYKELRYYLSKMIKKPLIHFQLGDSNKNTRIMNKFLTPVYDYSIGMPTGPGQMNIKEIKNIKNLLSMDNSKHYYVLGNPITKSLSPLIYTSAFDYCQLDCSYTFDRNNIYHEDEFVTFLNEINLASITIPYKNTLFKDIMDNYIFSGESKYMQAVNTIKRIDNNLYCFNTDWIGNYELLVEVIQNINIPLSELKVLVLGAGGAANSVFFSLSQLNIPKKNIVIQNRTKRPHLDLISKYEISSEIQPSEQFNIVISTVPSNADIDFIESFEKNLSPNSYCIDLAYNIADNTIVDTNFKLITSKITKNYIGGIEFLLRQAYYSFEIFSGRLCPRAYLKEKILLSLNLK